ncbi:MIP/aquaporin family protein [Deinococcus yavapaiensis]|uniref:MIP family channel protein n=1 Tax=Deinococcus yavapaiensis KR-236 TaxID=694435 RepID=A0A318S416_9DEIO|nr:aquaporin [Deinococcus yavapaiensis]PYE53285.1 MIP family channel protein [Deinococcus yavapaiensis KR-236]
MSDVPLSRAITAELVGTFALVFFGPGAAVVQAQMGALGQVGVALVFGLSVATVIAAFAPISGAHINPTATFALVLAGKFPHSRAMPYILAQFVGAVFAGFVLLALFGRAGNLGATVPAGSVTQAFMLELILTFFLLLVALRSGLPWIVGGVVALEALMGGPLTGASMNPARSIGPALSSGVWTAHWLYWVAPLVGAALAVLVNRVISPRSARELEPRPQDAREFHSGEA